MDKPEFKLEYNSKKHKFTVNKITKQGKTKKYFDSDKAIQKCKGGNPALLITLLNADKNKKFYKEDSNKKKVNDAILTYFSKGNTKSEKIENFLIFINSDIDVTIKDDILKSLFFDNPIIIKEIFDIEKKPEEITINDIFNSSNIEVKSDIDDFKKCGITKNGKPFETTFASKTEFIILNRFGTSNLKDFYEEQKIHANTNYQVSSKETSFISSLSIILIDLMKEKCDVYIEKNKENMISNLENKKKITNKKT